MATLEAIESKSSAPLTQLELEKVREIVTGGRLFISIDSIVDAVDDLTPVQRQATRADIEEWDALGFGTEKIRPTGGDGLDYDVERDRAVVRRRLIIRLGYNPAALMGDSWGVARRG